jgi:hypothetical protein
MSHSYRLGGHKLVSDIELPELMPWDGQVGADDVIRFIIGDSDALSDGQLRYVVPGPSRITIEAGSRVILAPALDRDMADTRALLMGPIQAVLWHQRGLLPLHASAVCLRDQAVAIAGQSGAGKSTLAAALASRGCPVLADDIAIIDPKSCELLTGQRRLRLWNSALDQLGIDQAGLPRAMSRSEKYIFEAERKPAPERIKVGHIVLPLRREEAGIALERLKGTDATFALLDVVHMLSAAHELGLGQDVFSALTGLQARGACVWRLHLPDELCRIDDVAAALIAGLDG